MKIKMLSVLVCAFLLQSCSMYTPEDYVGRTTLNANKFRDFGSRKIKTMVAQRDGDMLYEMDGDNMIKTKGLAQNVKTMLLTDVANDIEKIEALTVTEDSKEMIEKSLELFRFVKETYEMDYMAIAKLVDAKGSAAEIDDLMRRLDNDKQSKVVEMHNNLMEATVTYANANGVDFKRM